MANYVLRDLPQDVWDNFKERAVREKWPLKALFVQLMREYGTGQITVSTAAPSSPPQGFVHMTCSNGHHFERRFPNKTAAIELLKRSDAFGFCLECGETVAFTEEQRANLEAWAHTADAPW